MDIVSLAWAALMVIFTFSLGGIGLRGAKRVFHEMGNENY